MKIRLKFLKSHHLILLGIIFMVAIIANLGDVSAVDASQTSNHGAGSASNITKTSTLNYLPDPINTRTKESFKTIQEAIDSKNTLNGDTINVETGNYTENVKVNKRLVLKAVGEVNITAKNTDLPIFTITTKGSGSTIDGFKIIAKEGEPLVNGVFINYANNCTVSNNKFIDIPGNNLEVKNSAGTNIIKNSFSGGMVGIYLSKSNSTYISGNSFNELTSAMDVYSSDRVQVLNNSMTDMGDTEFMLLYESSNATVGNNILKMTHTNVLIGQLIRTIDSDKNTISKNTLKLMGLSTAITLQNSDGNHVTGNKILGAGTTGGGIYVFESDNNLIKDNYVNCLFNGITLESSLKNLVEINTVSKMNTGIRLFNCFCSDDASNKIIYNTVSKCSNGIHVEMSFYNQILHNTVKDCDENAIYIEKSEDDEISNNSVANTPTAIRFISSDECKVISNALTGSLNGKIGILIESPSGQAGTASSVKSHSLVGAVMAVTLPDINVHFNTIIYPTGIKNSLDNIKVNATQNWWGSNHPDFEKLVVGNVESSPWLVMTLNFKQKIVEYSTRNSIITSFNNCYNGKTVTPFNPLIGHIPDGTLNFVTTDIGSLNGNYIKKDIINGTSNAIFSATKVGLATITSTTDNATVVSIIIVEPLLKVKSSDPINNAYNVALKKVIKINFNKAIKFGSNPWIELKLTKFPGVSQRLSASIKDKTLIITPRTPLKPGTQYTIILHTNSIKDNQGTNIQRPYLTRFKTDTQPVVRIWDPAGNAYNVALNKVIKINFNKSIKFGTHPWIELKLTKFPNKTLKSTATIRDRNLYITPKAPLKPGTPYTIILHTNSIKDNLGTNIPKPITSNFTTIS